METVNFSVKSENKSSRVELFIRIVWGILTGIVLFFLQIIGGIAFVLQWFIILLTGERNPSINTWIMKYVSYVTKRMAYMMLLTDERNPILPED